MTQEEIVEDLKTRVRLCVFEEAFNLIVNDFTEKFIEREDYYGFNWQSIRNEIYNRYYKDAIDNVSKIIYKEMKNDATTKRIL